MPPYYTNNDKFYRADYKSLKCRKWKLKAWVIRIYYCFA